MALYKIRKILLESERKNIDLSVSLSKYKSRVVF